MQFRLSQDKGFLLEKSERASPHICVGVVRMYMKTCQMAKLRSCQHGMKVYVPYRLEDPTAEAIHCIECTQIRQEYMYYYYTCKYYCCCPLVFVLALFSDQ